MFYWRGSGLIRVPAERSLLTFEFCCQVRTKFFFATLLSTQTSYWPAAFTQSKKTHLREKYKKLCLFPKYLGGCFLARIWFLINQCSSSVAQQLPFWNLGFPKEELSKWQECPLASPTDNTIHPKICPPPPALLAKSANIAEKSREFADRHQVLRRTGYRVKGPGKWIFVTSRPRGREREAERGCLLLSVGGPLLFLESLSATLVSCQWKAEGVKDVRKGEGLVFHWITSAAWAALWVTQKLFNLNRLVPFHPHRKT